MWLAIQFQQLVRRRVAQLPGQSLRRLGYHRQNGNRGRGQMERGGRSLHQQLVTSQSQTGTSHPPTKCGGRSHRTLVRRFHRHWSSQHICNVRKDFIQVERPTELANAYRRKPLTSPDLHPKDYSRRRRLIQRDVCREQGVFIFSRAGYSRILSMRCKII